MLRSDPPQFSTKLMTMAMCATASILGLSASQTAYAQTSPPSPEASGVVEESPAQVAEPESDDIIVTGQKRAENVQDIPKQVAVVAQEQLAEAGISRLTDLQIAFPTLTAVPQGQTPRAPGIRGIAPYSFTVGVQSLTGIVVDDVPQATFSTLAFELADVERVEVFAGPQTTLSGRNSAAGLINIVTRSPSQTPGLDMSIEQTSDGQTRGTIFATAPITDYVAYSLSLLKNVWGGPVRNPLRGNERTNGFDTNGIRGKLLWDVTPDFKATLTGFYIHTDRKSPGVFTGAIVSAPAPFSFFALDSLFRPLEVVFPGIEIGPDNKAIYSVTEGTAQIKDRGGSLRLDYDLGAPGTLTSITSYTKSNQPRNEVLIGAPQDSLVFPTTNLNAITDISSKHITQELRLTSSDTKPVSYLAGVIYTNTDLNQTYVRDVFSFKADQDVRTESVAAFGRATLALTSKDLITGGLRYQHDKLNYRWLFLDTGVVSSGATSGGFWGGEVSVKHDFTPDIGVYATYARAETGKAYDLNDIGTAASGAELEPLDSTKVNSYEVGLKSQMFDRRLTFNINAFLTKFKDFQVQNIQFLADEIITKVFSVGRVESKGVELTMSVRTTNNLRIGFVGAYIDAEVKDFPNAACYTGQSEEDPAGCVLVPGTTTSVQPNLRGLQLPQNSKWRFTANADYRLPIGGINFDMGAFYSYQSKQEGDVLGDPRSRLNDTGFLNIFAGPSDASSRWSIQGFVNNVFDKRIYLSRGRSVFLFPSTGDDAVFSASYGRNSFRYGGIRANFSF